MDTVDSESTSEVEDQTKTWGSDARPLVPAGADDASGSHPQSDCGIGHRVLASRSVLALVVDEECVFAGLQGGDIVVSQLNSPIFIKLCIVTDYHQAWSLETYDLVLSVHAHKESVLGLYLSEDRNLLLSTGGDSVVNVGLAAKTCKKER